MVEQFTNRIPPQEIQGGLQIEVITPIKASNWLVRNTNNRPLAHSAVDRLASIILRGEWVLNGDSIKFSKSGVLLDGQHRLAAIVNAGVPVESVVIRGLDDSAFEVIDNNRVARTHAHVLAIKGEKNYNVLSGALRLLYFYERRFKNFSTAAFQPSAHQLNEVLEAHPSIRAECSEAMSTAWCRKYMTPTIYAFCAYVFREDDEETASDFMEKIETGAQLEKDSPALHLRNRLMEIRTDRFKRISKLEQLALTFKAYRAFRDGRPVKNLRIRMAGRKESMEKLFTL